MGAFIQSMEEIVYAFTIFTIFFFLIRNSIVFIEKIFFITTADHGKPSGSGNSPRVSLQQGLYAGRHPQGMTLWCSTAFHSLIRDGIKNCHLVVVHWYGECGLP